MKKALIWLVAPLAVGTLLWYLGLVAWYLIPAFVLVMPAVFAVAVIAAVAHASRNGRNPFI